MVCLFSLDLLKRYSNGVQFANFLAAKSRDASEK